MASPTSQPTIKPNFWRIQNITISEKQAALDWLREQVKELAIPEGEGFSLAPVSKRTLCATVTSCECPLPGNRDWHVDDDFIGFTPLSDPADATVDIVAVTGLGGHALGSFRSSGGASVWLRDFAPKDIPQARFITYGYNTAVATSESNQGIRELAHTLLDGLANFRKRTQTQQRPLLFFCHSLGGVVLKEALVMSSKATGPEHKRQLEVMTMAYGLVFMGVPNLGLKHHQLKTMVEGRPNEDFVRDLLVRSDGEASQFLSYLTDEFVDLNKRRRLPFQIVSYYETVSSPTVVDSGGGRFVSKGAKEFMVTKTSAERIGHLVRDIDHIPLRADHRGLVRFEHSEDPGYISVIEKLKGMAEKAPQALQLWAGSGYFGGEIQANTSVTSVRSIPFSQNRKFVGRKEELESLERKLFTDRDCGKMVIFGLGGIGKTQVVLQFAYLVLEEYPDVSVFWVPAVSFETFEQAYREMARLLEITDATGGNEDVKELVRRHLSAEKASKWVLVVDNADDMDILYGSGGKEGILQYLPESESGSTVFTTRDAYVAQSLAGSDVIEVAKMAHPEALHVLRNALIRKDVLRDEATTTRLMTELDYLPLATTQAAAYMNCNKVSLSGYLDLLKGTEQDIVQIMSTEIRDHTRYEQASSAVAKTWLVSFEQVVQRDADAADLLRYISCIEWKSIPQSILPSIKPAARMMSAIGTLCSYSFITPRDDEGKYDMHRLVHVAARIWLRQEGLMVETQRRALKHLSDIFPSDDYDNRKIWREYIPHVTRMRVTRECESAEVRGELCLKVGRCLEIDGRIRDAVDWLEESRDLRSSLPESHPDRLHSQHALAIAYQAHGQVKEAVQLLEQVVAMNNQLEEDYPDRLASQHSLAIAYQANGQVVEAVRLLEHVVAIREQVLLEDHPHRLASQHTLARSYTANGQTKKAIRLLEHVVAVRERILVEDHPHRLVSQAVLASAYQANGQAYKAVRLLEHVATINQRMLAEEHPDRLASQHSLGIAYQVNGQVKEAVQLLEHVVAIREQVLAKDHPHRLVSQAALASAYLAYRRTGWLGPRARVNTEEHGVDTTKAVASIAGFEQAMAQQPGQSRSSVCLGPSQIESRKERGHGTIREWWRKWKYEK